MGRQYYCDYCLRSFRDSLSSRKKHLKSGEHLRAKQKYFNQIKRSLDSLKDELNKTVCNHFYRNNFCKFGDNCVYSHLTYDKLQELKQKAIFEEFCRQTGGQNSGQTVQQSEDHFDSKTHLNIWLKNRFNICDDLNTNDNQISNFSHLRQLFLTLSPQQIPISLIPSTTHDFNHSEDCDWN